MSKKKLPYIPLFIGDWEQDTDILTLEENGALLKLTFKLWKSPTKGRATFCYEDLATMFKTTQEIAEKIVSSLQRKQVLDITNVSKTEVEFTSRRMWKKTQLQMVRSAAGIEGANKRYGKNQMEDCIADTDIEYEDEINDKKSVAKKFVAPTLEQVVEYFEQNGHDKKLGEKAFKYYNEADWHDREGKPVRNWKQKMLSVWFPDSSKRRSTGRLNDAYDEVSRNIRTKT